MNCSINILEGSNKVIETTTYSYNLRGNTASKESIISIDRFQEESSYYPGYILVGSLTKTNSLNFTYDSAGRLEDSIVNNKSFKQLELTLTFFKGLPQSVN